MLAKCPGCGDVFSRDKHGLCPKCREKENEIVENLKRELRSGDVVAIMSNGAFGGIHEKLLTVLSGRQR